MRLLLDQNLPKQLIHDFPEHEIHTVPEKGWNGIKNGELMQLLVDNNFDSFLTFEKGSEPEQNFSNCSITILVLSAKINSYEELTKLTPIVKEYLSIEPLPIGSFVVTLD
jgi:hypothetical protein